MASRGLRDLGAGTEPVADLADQRRSLVQSIRLIAWSTLAGLVFVCLVALLMAAPIHARTETSYAMRNSSMIVDDFTRDDGLSLLGTQWTYIADRVMGGVSNGSAVLDMIDERVCLHLRGEVSLENNGGFIQVALPLSATNEPFDGRPFAGIRLSVRGNGEMYSVHLRTSDSLRPWQYYAASFATTAQWQDVELPFSAFVAKRIEAPLDPSKLVRVGVVASQRAFTADIAIARIGFYAVSNTGK